MQLRKLSVLLLALLLAAMVMVSCVSADERSADDISNSEEPIRISGATSDIIEKNYVPIKTAREHATITLLEFISKGLVDEEWRGGTIDPKPTIIYDTNGKKLFYQFAVVKNGRVIGEIKTAVSKVVGISVISIGSSDSKLVLENFDSQIKRVMDDRYKSYNVVSKKFLAYSYPKIGILIQIEKPDKSDTKEIIIDAYSFELISDNKVLIDTDSGIISFYKQMDKLSIDERIADWDRENQYISGLQQKIQSLGMDLSDAHIMENDLTISQIQNVFSSRAVESGQISGFTTSGQVRTNINYCSIATAQMISKKYNVDRTQDDIAQKMSAYPNGGPTADNEQAYYRNYLSFPTATYRMGFPGYNKIKSEINAGRPLKIGLNGHSKALFGYMHSFDTGFNYYKFSDPRYHHTDPQDYHPEHQYWERELGYQTYLILIFP